MLFPAHELSIQRKCCLLEGTLVVQSLTSLYGREDLSLCPAAACQVAHWAWTLSFLSVLSLSLRRTRQAHDSRQNMTDDLLAGFPGRNSLQ